MNNIAELINKLDKTRYRLNEPMSLHTTVKIGGPADIYYEAVTTEDFIDVIKLARQHQVPISIIGRGSNTLIGDKGIRGIVINNKSRTIQIGKEVPFTETVNLEIEVEKRWESATENEGARQMYEFKDLNYDESDKPRVEVLMDSGVDMQFAVLYTLQNDLTGLQWYSRIPGTLGGWIYNNVHGGTHFIHEIVESVRVIDENNNLITLKKNELQAGYDLSRFHNTSEIIIDAKLNLYKGDKEKALFVAKEWAKRKSIQPGISLGCVFKNISQKEKERLNFPTTSVGFIVEHALKMKDFRVGDAQISEEHHNFIINKNKASAADYLTIIQEIKNRAKKEFDLNLETEIFYMGEFN